MEAVHETTVRSALGRIRFSFAADGSLMAVKLRCPDRVGSKGPRPDGAPDARALQAWVDAKLAGQEAPFPGRWEVPGATPFSRKVYRVVSRIPSGRTLSYAEVARKAGSPNACRAVGNAMARNPLPLLVPCHRVLGSAGLGGFTGGLDMKQDLLAGEAR